MDDAQEEGTVLDPSAGYASVFSAVMDTLAPTSDGPEAPAAGGAVPPTSDGDGQQPPAAQNVGGASADPGALGAGAAGESGVQGSGQPAAAQYAPVSGATGVSGVGVDASSLTEEWGKVSQGFEDGMLEVYKQDALETLRTDYPKYFEALEKHPRVLVGTEVPAIGHDGMETLRDSADAKEWQEAVRAHLADELRQKVSAASDDNQDFMRTVQSSVELFQKNPDLVPGTKQFDLEVANEFVKMATPYETRNQEGKLLGYQIPVQPLIDTVRQMIQSRRTAAPAAPAAPAATPATPPPAEPPQAGLSSKAGVSSHGEDFSPLFRTLGLDVVPF